MQMRHGVCFPRPAALSARWRSHRPRSSARTQCPYCTGLHVQLGRMAGLDDAAALNTTKEDPDQLERDASEEAFVRYGRHFGQNEGRGPCVEKAYMDIADKFGRSKARAAQGLGFFLLWGSMAGNTLNAFKNGTLLCNRKPGTNVRRLRLAARCRHAHPCAAAAAIRAHLLPVRRGHAARRAPAPLTCGGPTGTTSCCSQ